MLNRGGGGGERTISFDLSLSMLTKKKKKSLSQFGKMVIKGGGKEVDFTVGIPFSINPIPLF